MSHNQDSSKPDSVEVGFVVAASMLFVLVLVVFCAVVTAG